MGDGINVLQSCLEAAAVYTDAWTSVGHEAEWRRVAFAGFTTDTEHRGEDEVADGPRHIVFEEAANRLHLRKALMVCLDASALGFAAPRRAHTTC